MLREETAEEEMLVEDTEKVTLLIIISIFFTLSAAKYVSLLSKESVATDEGFHDESTNDTDPLVARKQPKETHR